MKEERSVKNSDLLLFLSTRIHRIVLDLFPSIYASSFDTRLNRHLFAICDLRHLLVDYTLMNV